MSGWRHNDDERRWELGYYDVPVERWLWSAWITDEMIGCVALPAQLAVRTRSRLGSVPPPLAAHLPPPEPEPALYPEEWAR